MIDYSALPLTEVAALNTPEALDYFWAHVDEGYFADRQGFYQEVMTYANNHIYGRSGRVCDFGCGCGQFLSIYKAWHDEWAIGMVYFGLDYSSSAIQRANDLIPDGFFFQHDISYPFFSHDKINVAFCIESLEHIQSYRASLTSIFNALRSGGHLIVTVPNNDDWHGHVNHWTQESFLALLSDYGEATVDLFHEGHNLIGHVVKR